MHRLRDAASFWPARTTRSRAGPPSAGERAETLRSNIQRLLEARVGQGHAIVEVNVDADMDSQTITERTVDPDSRVAISSDTEESAENATGTNPSVTVASNLPDGDVGGEPGQQQSQRDDQPRAAELRDLRDQARARRPAGPDPPDQRRGDGRRNRRRTATDGTDAWTPRPQEEMETLRQLVQSAIGLRRGARRYRDDLVARVHPAAEQGSVVERRLRLSRELYGARMVQLGVLAAIVLALIFFVLRPMMNRRPIDAIAELTGPAALLRRAAGARSARAATSSTCRRRP